MGYFVGIGAQKSGTTWLAKYMQEHPQIYIPTEKELHYFDVKYLAKYCINLQRPFPQTDEQYQGIFSSAIRSKYTAFGEITPSYSMLDERGFAAIKGMYPEAKIIFIMRNPVDRFWSQIKHCERVRGVPYSVKGSLRNMQFLLRSDYQRTWSNVFKCFDRENIFISFYEKLFGAEGSAEMERLTSFLGVKYIVPNIGVTVNSNLDRSEISSRDRERVAVSFKYVYSFLDSLYGDELPLAWHEDLLLSRGVK